MKALDREPVWTLVAGVPGVIKAVVVFSIAFGFLEPFTPVQDLALDGMVLATVAWLLRARVSPVTGTQDGSTIYPAGSAKQEAVNAKAEEAKDAGK